MIILGIDPGTQTGLAYFDKGELFKLETVHPLDLKEKLVTAWTEFDQVIFEDSRLTRPVWSRDTSAAARLKIARNVGMVDMVCNMIVQACEQAQKPARGISPKAKGAKLSAARFEMVTGWTARSNQHERDAAMVAWPYRRMAK